MATVLAQNPGRALYEGHEGVTGRGDGYCGEALKKAELSLEIGWRKAGPRRHWGERKEGRGSAHLFAPVPEANRSYLWQCGLPGEMLGDVFSRGTQCCSSHTLETAISQLWSRQAQQTLPSPVPGTPPASTSTQGCCNPSLPLLCTEQRWLALPGVLTEIRSQVIGKGGRAHGYGTQQENICSENYSCFPFQSAELKSCTKQSHCPHLPAPAGQGTQGRGLS